MSRIAIITGGSSGIGRALGAALVARGDDVVLAARTEAALQRTADELSAQGPGKARGAVVRWATEHMSAVRGPDELIPSTQS